MESQQNAVAIWIRTERIKRGWSQHDLASRVHTEPTTIERWEAGQSLPNRTNQQQLMRVFELKENTIEMLLKPANPATASTDGSAPNQLWLVPYRRNPYFTGREEVLTRLLTTLASGTPTLLTQVMAGLGGIGKTQTAVEYAYRFRERYTAVLWLQADDTASLLASLWQIAEALALPEHHHPDPDRVMAAVKHWFRTHSGWLLLIDNVEDISRIGAFLPDGGSGHILLTTRAQAVGTIGTVVDLDVMSNAEGCLFLLHRSKHLAHDLPLKHAPAANLSVAKELVSLMDGLPLALDQAGAYIEETRCSLAQYLALYQQQHARLLDRRGKTASDHPDSVTTTFLISFDRIKQQHPESAALLRCCAFLPSDRITSEVLTAAAADLGPLLEPVASDPIRLLDAFGELLTYSFLRRTADDAMWRIHRLLQVVLKDAMRPPTERKWAQRVVKVTERLIHLPDANPATLRHNEQFLPYVLVAADLMKRWDIHTVMATAMLLSGALAFRELGLYTQAEPLYKQIADLFARLQPHGRITARFLMQAGQLYMDLGQYDMAQLLYLWALKNFEEDSETTPAERIEILSYVANVFIKRQQFQKAENYCQRIMTIQDHVRAPYTLAIARCFSVWGHIAEAKENLEDCAGFHLYAKHLREQLLGPDGLEVAESYYDLTSNALMRGDLTWAKRYSKRAFEISRKARGPDHPTTAHYLDARAVVYREAGNYEQAEKLHLHARQLLRQKLEPNHLALIKNHFYLSVLYRKQGRDQEADQETKQWEQLYAKHIELTPQELLTSSEQLATTWREKGREEGANRLMSLVSFLRKHLL